MSNRPKIKNQPNEAKQAIINIDTVISQSVITVNDIVSNLCKALRNCVAENEMLKQELMKLRKK